MALDELLFDDCEKMVFRLPFGEDGAHPAPDIRAAGHALYGDGATTDVVAALLTNDLPSLRVLFGAVSAGVRLVSLPLPARAADPLEYAAWIGTALQATGASAVVARPDLAELMGSVGLPAISHLDIDERRPLAAGGAGFRLVQFTSGSTGPPSPLELDAAVLETNLRSIIDRVAPLSGDVTVSWLPLSHDMGLIGMVLAPLAAPKVDWRTVGDVVLIPPEQFLRRPSAWLQAMTTWKANFTAAPDFGYRLAARAASGSDDLSALRNVIVGGEVVRAGTLEAIEASWCGLGMSERALAPSYGMAEIGLAAAITGPDDRWRQVGTEAGVGLVASGRMLDGYEITVDPDTAELAIDAPALARHGVDGSSIAGPDGRLHTGDTGFVTDDGLLCVTGRIDDKIVANGRNVYAPAVEDAVSQVPGVREGRVTAVGLSTGGWLLAVEVRDRDLGDAAEREVVAATRRTAVQAVGVAPDEIVLVAPGRLPMTSSGKAKRTEVRRRWVEGTLADGG